MEVSEIRNLTWQQEFSDQEWQAYMLDLCTKGLDAGKCIACIGDEDEFESLSENIASVNRLLYFPSVSEVNIRLTDIIILSKHPAKVEALLTELLNNSNTLEANVQFKMDIMNCANRSLSKHDIFKNTRFYSSRFDSVEFDNLYDYSLGIVEKKCQVRDAQFLLQAIENIRDIQGGIFEFGSYRGHSGLLMSEYCVREGISKPIFLFDMFSEFPDENIGLDKIWNKTHHVDFEKICKIFSRYKNVRLVQGDFTQTYEEYKSEKISLAMVDCDSYRAVDYLLNNMLPAVEKGGIILFEDYGHEPCAGVRIAVDNFIKANKGKYKSFFCAYSGMFMLIKE